MRRLVTAVVVVGVAAAALATWGLAAPAGSATQAAPAAANKAKLPALPPEVNATRRRSGTSTSAARTPASTSRSHAGSRATRSAGTTA